MRSSGLPPELLVTIVRGGRGATMTPAVTVVMPCYNGARWLTTAVESVLGQRRVEAELVIVDDGSTDGSLRIAQQFEPRGVRIVHQENRGQAAACNHGLRLARGEFVKFLDCDDLLSPDALAIQLAALWTSPGKVAYSEWDRFYQDPSEAKFERRPTWRDGAPVEWLSQMWRNGQPMMQCGQFLIPRSLLERTGGWDERLSLLNDFEFFARIVLASSGVVFTPGARLYYRSGLPSSLSGQKSVRAWQSAALSFRLGTDYLVAAEDSPRTREAAAAMLQSLTYEMYPSTPELVRELESRIRQLGGSTLRPQGGKGFQIARRILGWKVARWMQIAAGKHPKPARPTAERPGA